MSTPNQRVPFFPSGGHVNTMLAERIQANIARLREAKKWSRPDLGRALIPPTSGQQIERLEKGQRQLDPEWIEKIAKALGVEPVALLGGTEQRYELNPQVADEIASQLASFVLRGAGPDPEIVQGLSILLQAMNETFSRNPEARLDPVAARIAVDLLSRQHGPKAS